jgi:hypothetical protein
MEIKQKLQDRNKALREEDAKVQHWTQYHDALELHEIEYEAIPDRKSPKASWG